MLGGTAHGLVDEAGRALPARRVDIGVRDARIVALGTLADRTAPPVVDPSGLVVAPGFIDAHSHTAAALASEDRSDAEALLRQGVTTVVVNPDGWGPVDLAAQRQELLEHGLGVHVAQMIGHSAVRRAVLGSHDRAPSPDELRRMRELVRTAFEDGAVGLSSGLFYAPGSFASTDELVALAEVAAEFGGVYQSHIRDESDYTVGLLAAVDEVIAIGERAGVTAVVTHVKALGPPAWGAAEEIVARIEAARARGARVWADQYPYLASATGLAAALLPRWAEAGDRPLAERLEDDGVRQRVLEAMSANLARRGGAERIQLRYYAPDPAYAGRRLDRIAAERGRDAVETALELLLEAGGDVGIVSFNMQRSDVELLMRQPWVMTASDGSYPPWGSGVPHPRGFGTFPRVLAEYVRERGVISIEQALDRATRLPALVYGIEGRGVLRVGAAADLVVLDAAEIADRATFEEPYQMAEGVRAVVVGGRLALAEGEITGERAGEVLRPRR